MVVRPVIDPRTCRHDDTEPVDVRDYTTGGTTTVARICRACLDELPAGWRCPDCEWVEIETRALCELQATVIRNLVRPCQEHA